MSPYIAVHSSPQYMTIYVHTYVRTYIYMHLAAAAAAAADSSSISSMMTVVVFACNKLVPPKVAVCKELLHHSGRKNGQPGNHVFPYHRICLLQQQQHHHTPVTCSRWL